MCAGRWLLFIALPLALVLSGGTASARGEVPSATAPLALTTRDVRQIFIACGYELAGLATAATSPYIAIRDRYSVASRDGDYRVLMSIVYKDATAARAAHATAHRQAEERGGTRRAFSDDHGPQLLAGYGASVWRTNVALVQSSTRTLANKWSTDDQTGEARLARPELLQIGFDDRSRDYGVDSDFVGCLEDGWPADGAAPAPVVPFVLPGRPQ